MTGIPAWNDWYSCLYVQGLQPTNHLGNHSASAPPVSNECNTQQVVWEIVGEASHVPELEKLSSGEQISYMPAWTDSLVVHQ